MKNIIQGIQIGDKLYYTDSGVFAGTVKKVMVRDVRIEKPSGYEENINKKFAIKMVRKPSH
jgi:preprotein translocase subunit YajC